MNTPIGRDFKRTPRRSGFGLSISREFFVGLGIGLAVAVGVYVWQQRVVQRMAAEFANPSRPQPRPTTGGAGDAADPAVAEESVTDYGFYEMLPKSEVIIPENPEEATTALPNAPIERPGVYVLESGSYRNPDDAERMRAKLARLGVEASIQRVTAGTTVIHRVRIGPINSLSALNRTRATLRAADIDVVVIRVGD